MARTAPTSRRLRSLAVGACAALTLPLLAAAPAAAQTSTTVTRDAATQASVVRITVNLPQGNAIQLDLSTASGSVLSVSGQGPEAEALATILRGSIAGNAQSFPGAEARLPEPLESSGPTNAIGDGIEGSPLGEFLAVGLVESSAAVSEDPSSTSTAQIADLGVGLPQQLADGLAQILDPLLAGLEQVIDGLEPVDAATQGLCAGIEPITTPVGGGVGQIPVFGPILAEVVEGVTDEDAGFLCNLRIRLGEIRDALADSLADLTGPNGIFGAGLLTASQTISTDGAKTTAEATATLADLQVLGVNPFGEVEALTTTSTAEFDGDAASADVETTAVEAMAEPILLLDTDLREISGELLGSIDLDALTDLVDQINAVLRALAGIGVVAGPLDEVDAALEACPEALEGFLSGTFTADGACAAAAAGGFGLVVELPEQLAGPLGIEGPLLAVQIVPTAAVVRQSVEVTTPAAPPGEFQGPLPRTGAEAPLAAAGVALLVGAALLRRRRASAEL